MVSVFSRTPPDPPPPQVRHLARPFVALLTCIQWRLFFAGLYPVEFRDFFLGDMYCSLTYAMCVSNDILKHPLLTIEDF